MHMVLRTLLLFLYRFKLKPCDVHDETEITMRVLPTDLDLLWHVNNGVYLSYMDFGRWDMVFRNGIYDLCKKNNWYPVVSSEAIKFKKSLLLWQKFTIKTKVIGYDEKNIFIQQKFYRKQDWIATGIVKAVFLKKAGGRVTPQELLTDLNSKNPYSDLKIHKDWAELENNYLN